jgi:4-hydroxy-2-oxoheptanedioate aldolase
MLRAISAFGGVWMRANKIKALWREGKPAAVCWVGTPDTLVAERLANAGFDGIVLDMQHGMGIGPDRAALWLQAVSTTDTVPLVRVPWNEPAYMQWVLDAGAYGVIVPLVGNAEEAAKAGRACRYPPLGYRSYGANRATFYAGADYAQHANDEVICLVMVEDIGTIPNLEAMAKAPGIDGFYVGPADLALTLGLSPGMDVRDARHAEAVQRVVDVAQASGLVAGIHVGGAEEAVRRFRQGFRFCPIGGDSGFLSAGARAALARYREGMGG